ncbi:MAG: TonB-dependent siderophore receptor [Gemmatimonadaceae bacterium]|nr:TonB-dependent siderophore receptor [Gemmatimonadaceae bacterium]
MRPTFLFSALAASAFLSVAATTGHAQIATPTSADSTKRASTTLKRVLIADSIRSRRAYTVRRTSSATRTSTLLRDVPQSATIITQALIADQGMQSMADVVRYIPGITMALGEGHRDAPTIRGNSSTADFFIDGIRDDAQYFRDIYNIERVEALKGSNAMVFGRGGGGGVLNRVTKNAQWTPTRVTTLTGGNFNQRRATLDVGQGVTSVLAARLNGLYEHSANFRQASDNERVGINPTAALMLGRTLIRLGYEFYNDRRVVDRGIPSLNGAPSPTPISTFFGDPDASHSTLSAHAVASTIDHQIWKGNATIDGLQLRNRSRFMRYDKFYQNIFPGAVDASATTVQLSGYNNGTDRTNLFNQTDITSTISRGALRQTLLVGADLGTQQTDNVRRTGYFGAAGSNIMTLNVPFASPMRATPAEFRQSTTDANNRTTLTTQAVYAQNQIEVGPHVQAILGLRLDRLNVDFTNKRTGARLSRADNLASPRAGIVIKPAQPVSIYGTYSVSFLPSSGDQFSSLTVTTRTLEPEQFTNREVGIKWDAVPDLTLTAAAYRLDRTNTTAPDPTNPAIIVQTGAQRTTGWELGITGALTSRWQIAGGFANQTVRITSRTAAAAPGQRVALVPRNTVSLWNRVQVTRRLGAGIGIVHQDRMFAAIDNSVTLPAFTRADAAAFVTLTRTLRAQLNIENLLDTRYYATAHSNNNIMPGSPRMIRVALHITP